MANLWGRGVQAIGVRLRSSWPACPRTRPICGRSTCSAGTASWAGRASTSACTEAPNAAAAARTPCRTPATRTPSRGPSTCSSATGSTPPSLSTARWPSTPCTTHTRHTMTAHDDRTRRNTWHTDLIEWWVGGRQRYAKAHAMRHKASRGNKAGPATGPKKGGATTKAAATMAAPAGKTKAQTGTGVSAAAGGGGGGTTSEKKNKSCAVRQGSQQGVRRVPARVVLLARVPVRPLAEVPQGRLHQGPPQPRCPRSTLLICTMLPSFFGFSFFFGR